MRSFDFHFLIVFVRVLRTCNLDGFFPLTFLMWRERFWCNRQAP